jgi:hypothetical protein
MTEQKQQELRRKYSTLAMSDDVRDRLKAAFIEDDSNEGKRAGQRTYLSQDEFSFGNDCDKEAWGLYAVYHHEVTNETYPRTIETAQDEMGWPQPRMQRFPDVHLRRVKSKCSTPGGGRYLVIILLGGVLGVCSAGEITNVTQVFQPSGRFWLANSQ